MVPRLSFHALCCESCKITILHHSNFPVPMSAVIDQCFNCGSRGDWIDLGIVSLARTAKLDTGYAEPTAEAS